MTEKKRKQETNIQDIDTDSFRDIVKGLAEEIRELRRRINEIAFDKNEIEEYNTEDAD